MPHAALTTVSQRCRHHLMRGDQYVFSLHIGALQHAFRCRVSTRYRGKLDIGPIGPHGERVLGIGLCNLRKSAVTFGPEGPCSERVAGGAGSLQGTYENPLTDPRLRNARSYSNDIAAAVRPCIRGKVIASPDQPPSASSAAMVPDNAPAPVPSRTVFEYQAVRVLMSVLLTEDARTRISTSQSPSIGTGRSSRHTNLSKPPWPVRTTPHIVFGMMGICLGV